MTTTSAESTRELRQRAEEKARLDGVMGSKPLSLTEAQKLVHELQVHQIELEMQNDELRHTHRELETQNSQLLQSQQSKAYYFDLFDLAPIGYLTFSANGLIEEANRAAATMFGVTKSVLLQNVISELIFPEDLHIFLLYRRQLIETGELQSWKLRMLRSNGTTFWAQLQAIPVHSGKYLVTFTDITGRMELESARDEALLRLQKIANRVPGVVYQYRLFPDGSSCFPFASESISDIYRVSPEEVREDASKVFANIHPDDLDAVIESIRVSAQDLTPWNHEYRVQFDDGAEHWLFGSALPELEAGGSVLWHGFISDITERKLAEEAFLDQKQFLRSTLDGLSAHICVIDAKGEIVITNRAWNTFGAENNPAGELYGIGFNYLDTCKTTCENEQAAIEETASAIRAVIAGTLPEYIREYPCHSQNDQRWFSCRVNPFAVSGVQYAVISHENISERKRAEELLREVNDKYRIVFDNANDPIIIADTHARILAANPMALKRLGYPCHSLDEKRWFLMIATRMTGSRGGIAISHTEITARKLAELELQNLFNELEERVQERTQDLTRGNEMLLREIEEREKLESSLQVAYDEISAFKDRLQAENVYLEKEVAKKHNFGEFIGKNPCLSVLFERINQVAPMNATVLVLGETGTGKGVVARAIHSNSSRKERPMITVNCTALPENLIESELFGREKGAFTGAHVRQMGRFELANGGTIFIDEIGEMPLELQSKLLRVIQDGEFELLGSPRTTRVDVRIIAATNRNLREEIRKGNFREDLYYRLNVFPLTIPPLRERKEDIPTLVNHFVDMFNKKNNRKITNISKDSLYRLQEYNWPGNVRELESIIERAVIISQGSELQILDRLDVTRKAEEPAVRDNKPIKAIDDLERDHIFQVLQLTGWRINGDKGAAVILGINPSTLRARIKKLGIVRQ
ncbi:MAG: sigma 54-interacting transcriptional regulator [Desulfuromonadaceae bacterium]